jgi:hypothetical protein
MWGRVVVHEYIHTEKLLGLECCLLDCRRQLLWDSGREKMGRLVYLPFLSKSEHIRNLRWPKPSGTTLVSTFV